MSNCPLMVQYENYRARRRTASNLYMVEKQNDTEWTFVYAMEVESNAMKSLVDFVEGL